MADSATVQDGATSPEDVAYKLMAMVFRVEQDKRKGLDRQYILDTYAECLKAVQGKRALAKSKVV